MKKTPFVIDKENLSASKEYSINWTTQEAGPATVILEDQAELTMFIQCLLKQAGLKFAGKIVKLRLIFDIELDS